MGDGVFRELLTATATVERPVVELDGDGAPRTPRYEEVVAGVAVRLAPARTVSEDDLLGRTEEVTLIAYLEPMDLRPGDRLVTRPVATVLSEDVAAGATEPAEGEAVRVVRRHEVIEVVDEAGAGHHLRAVVRVL